MATGLLLAAAAWGALTGPSVALSRRTAVTTAIGGALPALNPLCAWAGPLPTGDPRCDPSPLCDPSVTTLRVPGTSKQVTLVGTAHISDKSAKLVRDVVRRVRPDSVMVELDPLRAAKLRPGTAGIDAQVVAAATSSPSPAQYSLGGMGKQLLRGRTDDAGTSAVGYALSSLYGSLNKMGFDSGAEFRAALDEAEVVGATVVYGDRDAQATLRRLNDALKELLTSGALWNAPEPPAEFAALAERMAGAQEKDGKLTKAAIDSELSMVQNRANVRILTSYMSDAFPPLYKALIAERDEILAASLADAPGDRVVGVVGLAHVDGIERRLERAPAAAACM